MAKETTGRGYFDINIYEDKIPAMLCLGDIFTLKDLQQRKLYFSGSITQDEVDDIVQFILQFNREDHDIPVEDRQPILFFILSNGGAVDVGFELIDVIESSKTPIYTINIGYQYSMGFLIGIAGHKRFATKNARYLMHDGSHFIWDSTAKAKDQMKFQEVSEKRIKDYIISHSNLTEEEYDKKYRVEWYMFADEAKRHGFVDYIIGEDCELDSII